MEEDEFFRGRTVLPPIECIICHKELIEGDQRDPTPTGPICAECWESKLRQLGHATYYLRYKVDRRVE